MQTRILSITVLLLLALLSFSSPVSAEESIKPAPEFMDMLYSSRIGFSPEGVPLVALGLMHSQQEITFAGGQDIQVVYYWRGQRKLKLPQSDSFTVKIVRSKPAMLRYHVAVRYFRNGERKHVNDGLKEWSKRGYTPVALRTGTVFSLGGRVIDNQQYLISLGEYENEREAQKLVRSVYERYGVKATLHETLLRLPEGELSLVDSSGVEILRSEGVLTFKAVNPEGLLRVPRVLRGQGFKERTGPGRYRGRLYVALDRNGTLALGNLADLEQLIRGTVGAEIFTSSPLEALKAQAVAARGQLLVKLGTRHFADPYLLCTTQHCQVYAGADAETSRIDRAVMETRGQFLFNGKELTNTLYSAIAGGYTESNENVWPQPGVAALRGRPDYPATDRRFKNGVTEDKLDQFLDAPPAAYCSRTGYNEERFRWRRSFAASRFDELVNRRYKLGRVLDIKPTGRGVSGRLKGLKIVGELDEVTVNKGLEIRRLLNNLPSTLVRIGIERDGNSLPVSFIFDGAGWGHGVGMCQTGAIGRAKAGQEYAEILRHYYSGAKIEKLY